jgi:adenylate cyclase
VDAEPTPRPRLHAAHEVGAETVEVLRRSLARRAARLIRADPDAARLAAEMGLVDPRWLEHPTTRPVATATPVAVLERFLERSVAARPSRLTTIGLSAVNLIISRAAPDRAGIQEVTVVFTDLAGFTAFTERNGDGAALDLLQGHNRAAAAVVRRWQGRIVKHLGDGLLCVFPDPEVGVCAALELIGTAPDPLLLRAGVHHGEALVSRADVIGQTVNLAARVVEQTAAGSVTVTGAVAGMVTTLPEISVGPGRRRRLKGVSTPVALHAVTPAAAVT